MSSTHATDPTEPDEIRRDIEQTREQLSETVDALAARLDVKSRANEKVREVLSFLGLLLLLAIMAIALRNDLLQRRS